MTHANFGPLSAEEAHVRSAAYNVLEGEETDTRNAKLAKIMRDLTREAPLSALAVAFFVGVLFARRH